MVCALKNTQHTPSGCKVLTLALLSSSASVLHRCKAQTVDTLPTPSPLTYSTVEFRLHLSSSARSSLVSFPTCSGFSSVSALSVLHAVLQVLSPFSHSVPYTHRLLWISLLKTKLFFSSPSKWVTLFRVQKNMTRGKNAQRHLHEKEALLSKNTLFILVQPHIRPSGFILQMLDRESKTLICTSHINTAFIKWDLKYLETNIKILGYNVHEHLIKTFHNDGLFVFL